MGSVRVRVRVGVRVGVRVRVGVGVRVSVGVRVRVRAPPCVDKAACLQKLIEALPFTICKSWDTTIFHWYRC